jgi:hypothetical protein
MGTPTILSKLNMVKKDITDKRIRTTISNNGITQSKESFGGRSPRLQHIVYLFEFIGWDCSSAASDLVVITPVPSLAQELNNGNREIGVF